MSREIKFRGRTINGKWIYGDLCRYSCAPKTVFISNIEGTFQVIPETVGQFTGLKDNNGVEIYEGDILDEQGYKFIVEWDIDRARWNLKHIGVYQYPEWNRGVRMKVIGNIYENPELLEARQ